MAKKFRLKTRALGKFTYCRWLVRLLRKAHYIYLIAVEKPIWYKQEKSRIIYIGRTEKNADEALNSLSYRVIYSIPQKLGKRRLGNSVSVYFIDLSEDILPGDIEGALLYAFNARYGDIPKCNTHGKGYTHKRAAKVKEKYNITLDALTDVFAQIDREK